MKTIIYEPVIRDQHGEGQIGCTVVVYPHGTLVNGTTASDLGSGRYRVIIDPLSSNSKISRYYDVYVDGSKVKEKKYIAEWVWYVRKEITTTPQTLDFNTDLVDENGEALPGVISHAKIAIANIEEDRLFHITAQNDQGFTVVASAAGDGSLPVYLNFIITVGEA